MIMRVLGITCNAEKHHFLTILTGISHVCRVAEKEPVYLAGLGYLEFGNCHYGTGF